MAIKSKKVVVRGRTRKKYRIRETLSGTAERPRISVFRSSKHIYAQVVSDVTGETFAAASTLDADVKKRIDELAKSAGDENKVSHNATKSTKSVLAAHAVGQVVAERAKAKKIDTVVFDRNGFLYGGRVGAVADGARKGGLKF
jgi:large subunit ribosomal protein L18